MADYNLFNLRISSYGNTYRERLINNAKEDIIKNLCEHPNLRDVKISGQNRKLVILSKDSVGNSLKEVKKILSLPGEGFRTGEYVEFLNQIWLINYADIDDEIYVSGLMTLCPNILKFQDSSGAIHSYPYFIDTASSSLDENKIVVTSDSTRLIKLPFDNITRQFFIGKRFMGEIFNGVPQIWKITDLNSESERGLLLVLLERDEYNSSIDDIEEGICDKFIPSSLPVVSDDIQITYNGKPEIRAGGNYKSFVAKYFNENGEEVDDVETTWSVIVNPLFENNILTKTDGNKINIKAEDVLGIVGQVVTLVAEGSNNTTAQVDIAVVSLI